ncbi:tRNA lysidine(34) synthetase TilS [Candidatus Pantoea edessiphila]|uniref:tRNA(Ile)-lysidine synthase n=1 Tax=Candidatus Pantoea edessiphila TaxID=2044610 RepID=A0A2P5T0D1_9GAMM|nr:tRNA lysidine(34) synthetase TilS [Candidatus Pantoea edessiphila]PPI88010.1 tRNA lysidine(34) synthetase TilS [Candidatus Pantoea edessiphila]
MCFHTVDSLLKKDSNIVVAFSGGMDSTVLLHYLYIWKKNHPQSNLRAIHVNHGLHLKSNHWANHCIEICSKWKLKCSILQINIIDIIKKKGIEATARKERYKALISALYPKEILMTAHHLNDQCETFLLAIKRGSGPAGLASIYPSVIIGKNKILRPFLEYSHKLLASYAKKHNLIWVIDKSNYDINYDRNFLRHSILPKIIVKWPSFIKTVTRSSLLCREQENLIDELLINELNDLIQNNGSLYFLPLLKMSSIKVYALLRRWIAKQGGLMPSYIKLKLIYHKVLMNIKDKQPCLQLGSYEIRKFRHYLYWLKTNSSLKYKKINWKELDKPIILPQDLGLLKADYNKNLLRLPTSKEDVSIQFYVNGYVNILGRNNKYKIKKIWQELNIPPWNRQRIPLIFYNDILIYAVNLFVTSNGSCLENKNGWQVIWYQKNYTRKYLFSDKYIKSC